MAVALTVICLTFIFLRKQNFQSRRYAGPETDPGPTLFPQEHRLIEVLAKAAPFRGISGLPVRHTCNFLPLIGCSFAQFFPQRVCSQLLFFLAALCLRHPARTGVHPKDFLDPVSDNRQRVVTQFTIPDGPER
jgi:hypothetical protein